MRCAWFLLTICLGSVAIAQTRQGPDSQIAGNEPAPIVVGQPAPDFSMTDVNGDLVRLSSLIADGKNIVLIFDRAHW